MQNDQLVGEQFQTAVPGNSPNEPLSGAPATSARSQSPQQANTADLFTMASTLNREVSKNMQLLLEEMQSLKGDFDTKVKYDESKERLIDSLHGELQAYREGLHFRILRPVFIDLIAMHDDLGKLAENILTKDPTQASSQMVRSFEYFQETLEEVLRRYGVEAFSVEGTAFLSSKQRVLRVIDTPDPALDKQVAERVRKGFEYEGKVLRPEIVVTYRTISS